MEKDFAISVEGLDGAMASVDARSPAGRPEITGLQIAPPSTDLIIDVLIDSKGE